VPNVPWLTVSETAELLRVSKRTVYELIRSGDLHTLKFRRSRRITPEAIEAFKQRVEAAAGDA
jgi:excisionase family DNA binding protein